MSPLPIASAILLRCFLTLACILFVSVIFISFFRETAFQIHQVIFPTLTINTFEQTLYQMFAAMKVCSVLFFLVPWIAIRHYLLSQE